MNERTKHRADKLRFVASQNKRIGGPYGTPRKHPSGIHGNGAADNPPVTGLTHDCRDLSHCL